MTEIPTNEGLRRSLTGFNDVWKRVSGETTQFSDTSALQQFMQTEASLADLYTALARLFSGPDRSALLAQASDCRTWLRRLRAEYFIHTANTYTPSLAQRPTAARLLLLRHTMTLEQSLSQAYSRAAEQTAIPELSSLYQAYATRSLTHAQNDRALLIASF